MYIAYIFKAILAELGEYVQEAKNWEPRAPQYNLLHFLSVHHTENEDELVEYEVPELVFDMLRNSNR